MKKTINLKFILKTKKNYKKTKKQLYLKIKLFFGLKNDLNNFLINELLYISKLVGKKYLGNGSLIQTIKIEKFKQEKSKRKFIQIKLLNKL